MRSTGKTRSSPQQKTRSSPQQAEASQPTRGRGQTSRDRESTPGLLPDRDRLRTSPDPNSSEVTVEVVRSARRRKTVQARLSGGVLRVYLPAGMSRQDEARWVSEMLRRLGRRRASEQVDLAQRAESVAARYGLKRPSRIRWVDNQQKRWGSCTPANSEVRISNRLAGEPLWVLDYVIVHELAHLDHLDHGPAFWRLVNRYPLAERARGFLMARGLEESPECLQPGKEGLWG